MINKSFSIFSDSLKDFIQQYQNKVQAVGKPTLAIVFVNADAEVLNLDKFLKKQDISYIGTCSGGEFTEKEFTTGVYVGLFTFLPQDTFKIYHQKQPLGKSLDGKDLGAFARKTFSTPSIYMLAGSNSTHFDLFIKDLQHDEETLIPVWGGNAIDNMKFNTYTVFSNEHYSENSTSAIIFDNEKIEVFGDSYSGWKPMENLHTITKVEGNELLEVDGVPVLDIFQKYFGYFALDDSKTGLNNGLVIGNHPIQVLDETDAIYLKAPMFFDIERKSLTFFSSLEIGTQFKFCDIPRYDQITKKLVQKAVALKEKYPNPDGLIITSCLCRYVSLGPYFKNEVEQLSNVWGDVPLAGFLSGGEIGILAPHKESRFHNVTCVITGFRIK